MVIKGEANAWCDRLRERIAEWAAVDAERAALLKRSVELPDGLIDNADACDAVSRGAKGQKLWPLYGARQGYGESAGRRDPVGRRARRGRGHRGLASHRRRHREYRASKRGESALGCIRKGNWRANRRQREIGGRFGEENTAHLRRRARQIRAACVARRRRLLNRDLVE